MSHLGGKKQGMNLLKNSLNRGWGRQIHLTKSGLEKRELWNGSKLT